MMIAAASGDWGLGWHRSSTNRLVYGLYVVGAAAVLPASLLLVSGLLRAM
jgi:hypothetical protein